MSAKIHARRARVGNLIEDKCPCPQEPCGLVSQPSVNRRENTKTNPH